MNIEVVTHCQSLPYSWHGVSVTKKQFEQLNKITSEQLFDSGKMAAEVSKQLSKNLDKKMRKIPPSDAVKLIQDVVCSIMELNVVDVLKRCREGHISTARRMTIYYIRKYTFLTTAQIALNMELYMKNGKGDHVMTIYHNKKVKGLIEIKDTETLDLCRRIEDELLKRLKDASEEGEKIIGVSEK